MNGVVKQAARSAGARLAAEYGDNLPAQVERALHGRGSGAPARYADLVAIGSLIVSTATLAWTIYYDLKKHGRQQSGESLDETVGRTVRTRLSEIGDIEPGRRDHVIDVVVAETVRVATDVEFPSDSADGN